MTGDMDQDGSPDLAVAIHWGTAFGVEVWSPRRSQVLWTVLGPHASLFGSRLAGDLDVNGDGRNDLIIASIHLNSSDLWVHDNSGALLYRIPARSLGFVVTSVAGVGDLDRDGADDFAVGALDVNDRLARGTVAVISGRTGSLIRLTYGPQAGDAIGDPVVGVGDMDRDGVPDYAAGSFFGQRGIAIVYSGATGNVIHQWTSPALIGERLLGGIDADLDGVIDLISGAENFYNGPNAYGRVQVFSGRDGQVLWDLRNPGLAGGQQPFGSLGLQIAQLAPQPGHPYPVIVTIDHPGGAVDPRYGWVRAWRCNLPGTTVTGAGCSSAGAPPQIGVRRNSGLGRVVLSGAPPGALAWLSVSLGSQNSFGGHLLPLALDAFGLPGCTLRVPPTVVIPTGTGSAGVDAGCSAFDLPLGLVPAAGLPLAAQWLVLDPPSLGFGMTPRHDFRVQ